MCFRFDHPETQLHRSQTKCPVSLTDCFCRRQQRLCLSLAHRLAACVQVVARDERPYYEVTAGEQVEHVAPQDAARVIFEKMRGSF